MCHNRCENTRWTYQIKSFTQWNSGKCSIQFDVDGFHQALLLLPIFLCCFSVFSRYNNSIIGCTNCHFGITFGRNERLFIVVFFRTLSHSVSLPLLLRPSLISLPISPRGLSSSISLSLSPFYISIFLAGELKNKCCRRFCAMFFFLIQVTHLKAIQIVSNELYVIRTNRGWIHGIWSIRPGKDGRNSCK